MVRSAASRPFRRRKGDPTALARVLAEAIDGPGGRPEAVVVGIPGPVDYSTGAPLRLPNLPDWEGHIHLICPFGKYFKGCTSSASDTSCRASGGSRRARPKFPHEINMLPSI